MTDAMAALGMPPGTYRLGGRCERGRGERTVGGWDAGGKPTTWTRRCGDLVVFTGCEPAEAVFAATAVPADFLGIDREPAASRQA